MKLVAIDLFCGAGGLSLGLEAAGFKVAGAFDLWRPAVESYRLNFSHPCLMENVEQLTPARLIELGMPMEPDLVAGGPPCQGFSHQRIGGDEDTRNDLILAFGRVVIGCRAKMFMMENVTGLLGVRGRQVLARFRKLMMDEGYHIKVETLDAAAFGVPQHRRRVFVVGWRAGATKEEFFFPLPTARRIISVQEALMGLPRPSQRGCQTPRDPLHIETPLSPLNRRRIEIVPPGGGFEDLPMELRADCHKAGAARIGHRSVYGRLHPDRPAGTITAMFDSFTRGRFGHPSEPRNLTLREGARLQSFPDSHIFVGSKREIVKQIGNAIPPPLAAAMAKAISRALQGDCGDTKTTKQIETALPVI